MSAFELFGKFFKKMRQGSGLTLRQFCLKHELDPGNMSKIERGRAAPPKSRELLEKYAAILDIEKDSEDWYNFFDLAAACSGRIPPDLMDEDLIEKLPLVFRTLRGEKLTSKKLQDLAELIRKS